MTFRRLVRVFGSAEAVLAAPRERLLEIPEVTARTADGIAESRRDPWAEAEVERAAQRGIQILDALDDPLYPRYLLSTYDPPVAIYVDGTLLPEDALSVAIV